jgi:hypothetical protein
LARIGVTDEIDLRPFWQKVLHASPGERPRAPVPRTPAPRTNSVAETAAQLRGRGNWRGVGLVAAGFVAGVLTTLALGPSSSSGPSGAPPPPPSVAAAVAPAPRPAERIVDTLPPTVPIPAAAAADAELPLDEADEALPEPELVAPSRPVTTGKLELDVDPPVAVYLGERRLGRTPLEVDLEDGTHTLRFVDRRRFLDYERRFTVRAGRKRTWSHVFGMSVLEIEAPAGAKVYLDKRKVGIAPVKPLDVVEGKHRLRVIFAGQKLEETLDVPPSRRMNYRVNHHD